MARAIRPIFVVVSFLLATAIGIAATRDVSDAASPDDRLTAAADGWAARRTPEHVAQVAAGWEHRARSGGVATPRPPAPVVADDLGSVTARAVRPHVEEGVLSPVVADRRFVTVDSPWLPIPVTTAFTGTVDVVPDHVIRRSTWHEDCPVGRDELRWVRVTHLGFDGRAHAGELLVHESVADRMVEVFRRLYEARYPIERMRIAGPDHFRQYGWWHGADNGTGAFVCRQSTAGGKWSEHAYGLAVDINPYHNPYVKGEVIIPPGAAHYLERDDRPGIIHGDGPVRTAFTEELGWFWGGEWSSALDYMHFSWNDW